MPTKAVSIIGSVIFFVLAPGTVAGLIPFMISRWHTGPPFPGIFVLRILGGLLIAIGVISLVHCFARFALKGHGTPAPIAPTESLVVSGLYKYVRNPMYVAILAIILGQALLFANMSLLIYSAIVWFCFHIFIVSYEEPTLRRRYGEAYDRYRANVPRWLPRISPKRS
jgi:protein-S-isoprenylcysteine O-methyltransferase Ste14